MAIVKLLALISFVAIAHASASGQWRKWGNYKGTSVYYQRFERDRNLATVWVKNRQVVGRLAFDCSQGSVRQLAAIKNGQPFDEWGEYYPVAPKTFGEWLYQKACP